MEQDWQPSFFNLSVELMLEGLENALYCDSYRYHAERGYGSLYHTQVRGMDGLIEACVDPSLGAISC